MLRSTSIIGSVRPSVGRSVGALRLLIFGGFRVLRSTAWPVLALVTKKANRHYYEPSNFLCLSDRSAYAWRRATAPITQSWRRSSERCKRIRPSNFPSSYQAVISSTITDLHSECSSKTVSIQTPVFTRSSEVCGVTLQRVLVTCWGGA